MSDFNIDYTGKDYQSLVNKADLFAKELLPEWTSRDDNDINWVTIKTVAFLVSIGMFYIDLGVNEQDPFELQIYRNALRLARKYGMPVKKASGAITTLEVTIVAHVGVYILERGTEFTYQNKKYILWEDLNYAASELTKSTTVQYGTWERYQLGISNGAEFQEFKVERTNVANQKVRILINDSGNSWEIDPDGFNEWEQRDTLIMSYETDEHYRLILNDDEYYSVKFGDNRSGKIPVNNAVIVVEIIMLPLTAEIDNYGSLPAGNIDSSTNVDVETVIQITAASGGESKETLADIARNIPQWVATANRGVTEEDFSFLARRVSGVSYSTCEITGVDATVYVLGQNGTTSTLLNSVYNYLEPRSMGVYSLNVVSGIDVGVIIIIDIVVSDNKSRVFIKDLFEENLTDMVESIIAGKLTPMEIFAVMSDVDGGEGIIDGDIIALYKDGDPVGMDAINFAINERAVINSLTINATGGIV